MLELTKEDRLRALKYWTFFKNILPLLVLIAISFGYGALLFAKSLETYCIRDEVMASVFLCLLLPMSLFLLISVLYRYKQSLILINQVKPKTAELVWLDDWATVCLSFNEESSSLVPNCPKRILLNLHNYEKVFWPFARYLIVGEDRVERVVSKSRRQVVLYHPDKGSKNMMAILFIGTTPLYLRGIFEVYPEVPEIGQENRPKETI